MTVAVKPSMNAHLTRAAGTAAGRTNGENRSPQDLQRARQRALASAPFSVENNVVSDLKVVKRLAPGQRGAVALSKMYGESLVCVRHRQDAAGTYRYVTVEILVEQRAIEARNRRWVGVRLDFREAELRAAIKRCGGKWDSRRNVWKLERKTVTQLALHDRVVMAY